MLDDFAVTGVKTGSGTGGALDFSGVLGRGGVGGAVFSTVRGGLGAGFTMDSGLGRRGGAGAGDNGLITMGRGGSSSDVISFFCTGAGAGRSAFSWEGESK